MPGWGDDEESQEQTGFNDDETPQKIGAESYMIVIRFKGLSAKCFMPHHYMLDKSGKQILSTYGNKEPRTEEATPDSVFCRKTVKWTTKMDILNALGPAEKSLCNLIKGWFAKAQIAVWYHNAAQDQCATFGGAHLHAIWQSPLSTQKKYVSLSFDHGYRTLKKKVESAGGYMKMVAVKNPLAAVTHFCTKPRIYLGTNSGILYHLIKKSKDSQSVDCTHPDDVWDTEDQDETAVAQEEESLRDHTGFSDDEGQSFEFASSTAEQPAFRRTKGDLKRKVTSNSEHDCVLGQPKRERLLIKETEIDQTSTVLRKLVLRWGATTYSDMFKAIAALPQGIDEDWKSIWFRLSTKTRTSAILAQAVELLKSEYMYKSFDSLIDEFCNDTRLTSHLKTLSPEESYDNWCGWVSKQGWDLGELIRDIYNIMDRTLDKVNTLCIIGDSNSGKTVMITRPLCGIAKFVGMIGNRGANSQFVYQECPNQRMIAIDECVMTKEVLEDLKLLTGGEDLMADVKGKGHARVSRTPVIMTGNKDPWLADFTQREPLMNRFIYYRAKYDDELKDCKQIHPAAWWYIRQIKDTGLWVDSSTLIPCPIVANCTTPEITNE